MFVEFVQSGKKKFVLLEGDQATYERLQSIKALYGNDLRILDGSFSRRLAFSQKLSRGFTEDLFGCRS